MQTTLDTTGILCKLTFQNDAQVLLSPRGYLTTIDCTHSLILTASILPRLLLAANIQLIPANAHSMSPWKNKSTRNPQKSEFQRYLSAFEPA